MSYVIASHGLMFITVAGLLGTFTRLSGFKGSMVALAATIGLQVFAAMLMGY